MAQKSSLITLFFDKYFDKCQYIYALKIADMGYTFDRISKYLWDLYKNECVSKIGNLPSDVDYTKGFVDEIMSFSFFRIFYTKRSLNGSSTINRILIKRLIAAINKFYSVNIDLKSFCDSYDSFLPLVGHTRLVKITFLKDLLGIDVTLDCFKYLMSVNSSFKYVALGECSSWLEYFVFYELVKIFNEERKPCYLSISMPLKPASNLKNIVYLRVSENIVHSTLSPQEYILSLEDKLVLFGENKLSLDRFIISAIECDSWIIVHVEDIEILECTLPSAGLIDQNLSFFTGTRLNQFNQICLSHSDETLLEKSVSEIYDLICINPIHLLQYINRPSGLPESMISFMDFLASNLLGNGMSQVKLSSLLYFSRLDKQSSSTTGLFNQSDAKCVSKRLSLRGILSVSESRSAGSTITSFLKQPLFSQETLYKNEFNFRPRSSFCFVFCHFDSNGVVNKSVQHYLNSISAIGDVIFVSNSPLLADNKNDLAYLNQICMSVYVRDNDSYDFGCWAYGITKNLSIIRQSYNYLVCCNDSCVGPLRDLSPILNDFIAGNVDVGGLTACKDRGHHLQSYFIFYNKSVINSQLFQGFWENIRKWKNKVDIVDNYEVAWMRVLILTGFNVSVYFDEYFSSINHSVCSPLILLHSGFPFIKREVIEKNPLGIDLDDLIAQASFIFPDIENLIVLPSSLD